MVSDIDKRLYALTLDPRQDTSVSCFTALLLTLLTSHGQAERSITSTMSMHPSMNLMPPFTSSMFFSPHEMSNPRMAMPMSSQYRMSRNRSPSSSTQPSSGHNYTKQPPKTILVDGGDQTSVNLVFRSSSTRLNVMQDHSTQSFNKVHQMQTHEEPVKLVLNITKPVIQEVNEVIIPYRNIKQEIQPVKEYIETTVMKKKNSYPSSEGSKEEETGYTTEDSSSSEDHYEQQASFENKPPMTRPEASPPMPIPQPPTTPTQNEDDQSLSQIKRYVNYIKSQDATHGPADRVDHSNQQQHQVKSNNQFNQASFPTLDLAGQINLSPTEPSDKLTYVGLKPDMKRYTVNQQNEAGANVVRYLSPELNSAILYLADWQEPYQESRATHTVRKQSESLPLTTPTTSVTTNSTTKPQV